MDHVKRFLRRLLNVLRPHARDVDVTREISAHLTLLEDEYTRRGFSPGEAHRLARVALGGMERTRELHRAARSFQPLDEALRDVRYAVRLLRRTPVVAITAILSLAIAIGATTTVFTAVNALLMRTAPGIANPDRVVDISLMTGPVGVEAITYDQFVAIRDRATRVENVFGYALNLTPMSWGGGSGEEAQAVHADVVTPNFFTGLGVTPAAGRLFADTDSGSVVVLSYRFWAERRQSDPAVVNSVMRLGDDVFTVIGVASREFHGNTVLAPDLWIPTYSSQRGIGLVGARLRPGVTIPEANAEIEEIGRGLTPRDTLRMPHGAIAKLRVDRSSPVPYGVRVIVAGFLSLLMAIVSMVLIVACANVAGLQLARAAGRARETAVRVAMGVSQARLVRQHLTETIVLFAAAGIAALLLSRIMTAAIVRVLPSLPLPSNPALTQDSRVVAFALGLSFAAAFVFGLAPALRAARVDVLSLLKAQEQGNASALRLRRAFVVAQVTMSIVLVIMGGLLTRALVRTAVVDQGFDAHGVDVVSIDLSTAGYTPGTARTFIADVERRLRSMPLVESAALAAGTPNSGAMGFQIGVPGVQPRDGRPLFDALGNVVTPGYFETLRIPLIAGRDFVATDSDRGARVVIVSRAAVREFWPSLTPGDAVGRQILLQPNLIDRGSVGRAIALIPMTVVGIAGDLGGGGKSRPYIYLPAEQQSVTAVQILVRAGGERRGIPQVRELLQAMDRRLPILTAGALDDQAGPATIQLRISAAIAGTLGLVGVLLATIGVYGVTTYLVAQRTREIGIRMALGADRPAVIRMAIGETVRLLAAGGALGLLLAAAMVPLLRNLSIGIAPADPVPFAGAMLLFAFVGLAASYVPIRRALAIDPSRALRYE